MLNLKTNWKTNNIKIKIDRGYFFEKFSKWFFKGLIHSKGNNEYLGEIRLTIKKKANNESIKHDFFDYSRSIQEKLIVTEIYNIDIFRAIIREIYKFLFPSSSVVGIYEVFLAILRTGVFEPIEYLFSQKYGNLIHGAALFYKGTPFVLAGTSRSGKSTIVKYLQSDDSCKIASDNYLLLDSCSFKGLFEPLRGGKPSRYRSKFYGKGIYGWPDISEINPAKFFFILRSNCNSKKNIEKHEAEYYTKQIYNECKEGISFLNNKDVLKKNQKSIELPPISYYLITVAEGINNIKYAIRYIEDEIKC